VNVRSDPAAIDDVLARFRLAAFRPGQREVIEAVLAGRPTIAVLPTGAGKSLCYQLPAVALGGLTIVVSPLIALMKDQVDALVGRGIPATFINSSISSEERSRRLQAALRGDVRLLYVAPERFRVPAFADALERRPPTLLAIDEAHCIVEWGPDFRPDYARLGEVLQRLRPARVVALTATATPDVRAQIACQLGFVEPAIFVRGFDRANLQLRVVPVSGDDDKLRRCIELLNEPDVRAAPSIIYTATRKKAEQVAQRLCERGIAARAYHAGLADAERIEVQTQWMADRRLRVVVATNAFGMGIDQRDVRLVLHHDIPGSIEAYYQEAGRAGRDGLPARCVLLFNHADVKLRQFLIEIPPADGREKPAAVIRAELARLDAMVRYAYVSSCRRAFLLGYFGDDIHRCGEGPSACDACAAFVRRAAPSTTASAKGALSDDEQHLIARKVLSCVARVDGRFGVGRIALCLRGSGAPEVTDVGLHQLSTYGVLKHRSHDFVLELMGAFVDAGLLALAGNAPPRLQLTAAGREVMLDRKRSPVAMPRERPQPPAAKWGPARPRWR
jgi:ATP-dependent DNA helicase RecQ